MDLFKNDLSSNHRTMGERRFEIQIAVLIPSSLGSGFWVWMEESQSRHAWPSFLKGAYRGQSLRRFGPYIPTDIYLI